MQLIFLLRETDDKHKKLMVSMKEGDKCIGKTSRIGGTGRARGEKVFASTNMVARLDFAK